jgi:DNA-binding response OmpR family regulator
MPAAEPAAGQPEAEPLVVLLVEDTVEHATLYEAALDEPGQRGSFRIERADRLAAALERLDAGGIDVALLDLMLPDSDGLETFRALHGRAPEVPVVVVIALSDESLAIAAVREGAQDYLVKGVNLIDMVPRSLRYAVERQRARLVIAREQAARAEAEAELRLARLAERQRRERQERELRSLERLSHRRGAVTTARAFGIEPLSLAVPEKFAELVARYGELLDRALEQRTYRVEDRLPDALRALAHEIGFLHAGPRDVIELHTRALRDRIAGAGRRKAQGYVDEGRVAVLELMGYLVAYYRG